MLRRGKWFCLFFSQGGTEKVQLLLVLCRRGRSMVCCSCGLCLGGFQTCLSLKCMLLSLGALQEGKEQGSFYLSISSNALFRTAFLLGEIAGDYAMGLVALRKSLFCFLTSFGFQVRQKIFTSLILFCVPFPSRTLQKHGMICCAWPGQAEHHCEVVGDVFPCFEFYKCMFLLL